MNTTNKTIAYNVRFWNQFNKVYEDIEKLEKQGLVSLVRKTLPKSMLSNLETYTIGQRDSAQDDIKEYLMTNKIWTPTNVRYIMDDIREKYNKTKEQIRV